MTGTRRGKRSASVVPKEEAAEAQSLGEAVSKSIESALDLVSHNGYAAAGPTGRLCDRLKLGTQNGLSPEFFVLKETKSKRPLLGS